MISRCPEALGALITAQKIPGALITAQKTLMALITPQIFVMMIDYIAKILINDFTLPRDTWGVDYFTKNTYKKYLGR